MSNHSPKPWETVPTPDGRWLLKQPSQHVEMAPVCIGTKSSKVIGFVFLEDDARRIVDCVNALAGIEDPETWVRRAKVAVDVFGAGLEEFADP